MRLGGLGVTWSETGGTLYALPGWRVSKLTPASSCGSRPPRGGGAILRRAASVPCNPPRRSDGARWHEAQARPCELDTDELTQQSRRTPLALVLEVGAGGQQVVREANLRGGVGRVR